MPQRIARLHVESAINASGIDKSIYACMIARAKCTADDIANSVGRGFIPRTFRVQSSLTSNTSLIRCVTLNTLAVTQLAQHSTPETPIFPACDGKYANVAEMNLAVRKESAMVQVEVRKSF